MDFSEIVIGSLSILTGGIVGTSCVYLYTKENMWEAGRDNFLPINAPNTDWQLIQNDLSTNNNLDNEIKNLDINKLKKWCEKKYKETFSSIFHSTNWVLLAQMKNACLLPIKKKLEDNSKNLIQDLEKINIDKLTNINENKYQLTYKLKNIKGETDKANMKRLLFSWCHNISEHGYQNENTNKYKLVKELCIPD